MLQVEMEPVPDGAVDRDDLAASLVVPDRFGALFDRHARTVHRYFARRVSIEDAENLTTATFVAAFGARRSMIGEANIALVDNPKGYTGVAAGTVLGWEDLRADRHRPLDERDDLWCGTARPAGHLRRSTGHNQRTAQHAERNSAPEHAFRRLRDALHRQRPIETALGSSSALPGVCTETGIGGLAESRETIRWGCPTAYWSSGTDRPAGRADEGTEEPVEPDKVDQALAGGEVVDEAAAPVEVGGVDAVLGGNEGGAERAEDPVEWDRAAAGAGSEPVEHVEGVQLSQAHAGSAASGEADVGYLCRGEYPVVVEETAEHPVPVGEPVEYGQESTVAVPATAAAATTD
jgi:hypothetical protein